MGRILYQQVVVKPDLAAKTTQVYFQEYKGGTKSKLLKIIMYNSVVAIQIIVLRSLSRRIYY